MFILKVYHENKSYELSFDTVVDTTTTTHYFRNGLEYCYIGALDTITFFPEGRAWSEEAIFAKDNVQTYYPEPFEERRWDNVYAKVAGSGSSFQEYLVKQAARDKAEQDARKLDAFTTMGEMIDAYLGVRE